MADMHTKDLTTGSPMKLILSFMLPLVFGLLFQQVYSMVDTIVVGKFLGVDALAGVGSTGSITFLVLGLCNGVCAGFAIPVAQKFGQRDFDGLRRFVGNMTAGLSSEEGVPAALRAHWNAPDAFVGVVHRLDTGVSGLMVYARTPAAAAALSRQVTQSQDAYAVQDGRAEGKAAAPQFVKQYRAVLAGVPDAQLPAAGVLRDYLFKDSRKGRVFPVSRPRKGVREAVLEYRILATAGESSLAEITLHTGRTHQIRVQFASRRHPLYGDGKYGSRQKGSIALQSCGLRFVHPDTGKPMAFSLPLPAAAPWKEFLELGE